MTSPPIFMQFTGQNNGGTASPSVSIGQKRQLTGQNLHNEHAQCDMREGTNFKGSDSSYPSVYFLFCDPYRQAKKYA